MRLAERILMVFGARRLLCVAMLCVVSGSQAVMFHGHYPRSHYCDVYHSRNFSTEYCYYEGSGPLVVLMPDVGSNMDSWSSNFLKIINDFSAVLIYNRPHYGDSKDLLVGKKRWVGVGRIGLQLNELLAHLKLKKKTIVLGYGAGAYYAQYSAAHYPNTIDGMVLVNSLGSDQPCDDYRLYHNYIPAQRSLGYREFLGLQRQEKQEKKKEKSNRKKFLMSAVLVSNPSQHDSKKTKARWDKRQKSMLKHFKHAQQLRLDNPIDEHSSASQQAKLVEQLQHMVKRLSS